MVPHLTHYGARIASKVQHSLRKVEWWTLVYLGPEEEVPYRDQ